VISAGAWSQKVMHSPIQERIMFKEKSTIEWRGTPNFEEGIKKGIKNTFYSV
jgi:hypothetical protein